jgi:hypothetical protein
MTKNKFKKTLFRPLVPMLLFILTESRVKILHWWREGDVYDDGLGGVGAMNGDLSEAYSSRPDSRAGQELAEDKHHQQAQFSDGEVSLVGEGGLNEVVGDSGEQTFLFVDWPGGRLPITF